MDDLVNVLLKRLIYKEFSYNDLFQKVVDFLFQCCVKNTNCQKQLLSELNFFLDMMNIKVETGVLLSEIIRSNEDHDYIKNFIRYIINKITQEGYYKSTLFHQLIKLA
jgi:hypothetical protein